MTEKDIHSIPWWKKAIYYQIYPRSFLDTNGDGVGDIRGIINKLDYLNDGTPNSLGIDALWISPLYPSPNVDFGYDISDYNAIASEYGTIDDFKELLEKAHLRGMKIVMDLVINHTSIEHPWFIESRNSKENPKRDWYIWHPKRPNNWFAELELGSAWIYDEKTREYYLATFHRWEAEVNWRNPDLKKAMYDVIRFWFDMGVDGYRMDVVNWYIKDDQLRSNPWSISLNPPDLQKHLYDRNRPETHLICKEIRKITDEYKERMLVGEVYADSIELAAEYYGNGDELHFAFNFPFLFSKWSAKNYHRIIETWNKLIPEGCWPCQTLSNHDQPRHYEKHAKGKWTEARAKVALAMLLTIKGAPFLYQGEEIGMSNGKFKRSEYQDIVGKKLWPIHKGRDCARTPMQWNDSPNAGFTTGTPWLKINPDYKQKNIATQLQNEHSLLSYYRQFIWFRKKNPVLSIGEYQSMVDNPKYYLAFKRFLEDRTVYILLNFTHKSFVLNFSSKIKQPTCQILFGTHKDKGSSVQVKAIDLGAYEVLIME